MADPTSGSDRLTTDETKTIGGRTDHLAEIIARRMVGLDLARLPPEDRAAWLENAHDALAAIGAHLMSLTPYEFGQTMKAIMEAGRVASP